MDEIKIRAATELDLPELLEMAAALHKESLLGHLEFSPARFGLHARYCIAKGFLMVHPVPGAGNGHLDAFLMGMIGPAFYSDCLTATELICYARPGSRGGGVCGHLVLAFVEWGRVKGATEIQVGSSAGINTEGVRRFYERCGFVKRGELMARRA